MIGGIDEDAPPPPTLDAMFKSFAKYQLPPAFEGNTIILSQLDMWFKQSHIFTKNLTLTDTGMMFSQYKSRGITFPTFIDYLTKLCASKGMDLEETMDKLTNCGMPGTQKID